MAASMLVTFYNTEAPGAAEAGHCAIRVFAKSVNVIGSFVVIAQTAGRDGDVIDRLVVHHGNVADIKMV